MTVTNDVPQTGSVQFLTPKWNTGTQNLAVVTSMFKYNWQGTAPGTNGYAVECEADGHPDAECFFLPVSVVSADDIITTRDIFTVTNLATALQSGAQITFRSSGSIFRNPPTTKPVTTFGVRTVDG